uniref:(northern house mosquito) hypothetical protein n=1 Tax=Culex pipiens TaxID=7175 RepID=A0A8D8C4N8_CULPI
MCGGVWQRWPPTSCFDICARQKITKIVVKNTLNFAYLTRNRPTENSPVPTCSNISHLNPVCNKKTSYKPVLLAHRKLAKKPQSLLAHSRSSLAARCSMKHNHCF